MPNNYKKVVKDILKSGAEDTQDLVFKINVTSYEKNEQAIQHIEQILQQLKDRSRGVSYIVVTQSQYKLQRLMQLGMFSYLI